MRTTLNISNDVLQSAKERARRDKKTIGEVISDLARTALTAPPTVAAARVSKAVHGFRPFPRRGGVVTNKLIDKLRGRLVTFDESISLETARDAAKKHLVTLVDFPRRPAARLVK